MWCTAAAANFGEVVIPTTLPESVTAVDDSSLLVCSNPVLEDNESYLIGNLTTRAHNVTGTVYLISDHIIEIKVCCYSPVDVNIDKFVLKHFFLRNQGFTYDGEGPAAYFYMDTAAEPTANGLSLLDSEGGTAPSCGMVPLLAANGTDTYRAEFPSGTSIQDYLGGSFSVWCTTAAANFGEVVIPTTLPESVTAVDDSSLLVCSNPVLEDNESYLIGNLTTRAHNVTGTVYLISDHIIEIKVCCYSPVDVYIDKFVLTHFFISVTRDLHTMERVLQHTFIWTLQQNQRRMGLAYLTVKVAPHRLVGWSRY